MSARGAARGVRTPGRAAGAVRPARAPTHVRRTKEHGRSGGAEAATQADARSTPNVEELETAALTVPEVAEAAAVPVRDEAAREWSVEMYVALKTTVAQADADRVTAAVEREVARFATPKNVRIVPSEQIDEIRALRREE